MLSAIRNPYDWYVSQYEFSWWKNIFDYYPESHPTPAGWAIEKAIPQFEKSHPHFPEITFAAFLQLCEQAAAVFEPDRGPGVGLYTHSVIRYYYRNPARVLSGLAEGDSSVLRKKSLRFDVTFIRTDRLQSDLTEFLLSKGYRAQEVAFIAELGRILPMDRGRSEGQRWEDYYTPELKHSIRQRDWPVFQLFPGFDV